MKRREEVVVAGGGKIEGLSEGLSERW